LPGSKPKTVSTSKRNGGKRTGKGGKGAKSVLNLSRERGVKTA